MTMRAYRRLLWLGLAAVMAFSPIGKGLMRTWSLTPALLLAYFSIFLWLYHAFKTRDYKFRRTLTDKPIAILAAIAALSAAFSIYKHDSVYALIRILSYAGVYYMVVNEFDHVMRRGLIRLVIWTGAALSAYGILQYLGVFDHSWWDPQGFLASTYVNHNNFSGYLELSIPAAFGMLSATRYPAKGPRSITLMICLLLMMTAFILSQSRGAWISLATASLFMAFLAPKKDKADRQRVVLAIVLSAMICGIVFFGRDVIADRLGTMSAIRAGEEASFSTRIKAWQGAIKMIAAHPLTGTGIGTFVWGYPPYRPEGLNFKTDLAHNDYLQAAAEMGLAAAFVVIWAIALTVMTAVSKAGLDKVKFYCGIGVLSMALHGLVDFNFNIPANMLLFTVWTALIMSEGRRDAERKR